jgi:arsenate reductase
MKTSILFVCTGNIARSQMAEGLARALAPEARVGSAGSQPNPKGIHPLAVQVMCERGIDISHHRPKNLSEVDAEYDYVITLCDHAAQSCPVLPALKERLHWSIPDPAAAGSDSQEQLEFFREIRDELEGRIKKFLASL